MTQNERADAEGTATEQVAEATDSVRVSPFKAGFAKVATKVSDATGSAWTFTLAALVIIGWVVTGPMFGFSDTWQLIANTFTTIVTFLMVFLIQNTQNRDAKATQLKLDELIRAVREARNEFIGAESEPEEQMTRQKREVEEERGRPTGPPSNDRRHQPVS